MHPFEEKIAQARHITLVIGMNADSFGSASAFYSYLMTLHKKVSLFCESGVHPRLAFIPWSDKVRQQIPKSSDLAVFFDSIENAEITSDTIHFHDNQTKSRQVYDYLKHSAVRINAKMATALYAGLLESSQSFTSPQTDASHFDMASELMQRGADARMAVRNLRTLPLNALRLKGALLSSLELKCEARVAVLRASHERLESTAAGCSDCADTLAEALCLPTVEIALLLCEQPGHSIRGILQSKEREISAIAELYGGGGEPLHAEFLLDDLSMETAEETIMLHVKERLEKTE